MCTIEFLGARTGQLAIARGGRVRLHLEPPLEELFVCDGANAWHHHGGANHVRVESASSEPVCYLASLFERMPGKQRALGQLGTATEYDFQVAPLGEPTYAFLSIDLNEKKLTWAVVIPVGTDEKLDMRIKGSPIRDASLPPDFFSFKPPPGMIVNGTPLPVPKSKP